ncbi:MAG: alpha-glucan family phosphorylase [Acidobacteriota bacterium]|nr:alpha-glucan family phosphorylase [Acidobacteriota bacterium]
MTEDVHDGATLRAALTEIAGNFSFSWTPGARQLFAELDRKRFSELLHNPTALLSELTDGDLGRALTPEYAMKLGRVQERLEAEAERPTWWDAREGRPDGFLVGYFSAEFGLDESLPVYSGGLGILAGDHLKSASELGVPLVAVGLNYFRGYFRQRLDEGDRQVERYPRNDGARLPLTLVPMAPTVELADEAGNLVSVRIGVSRALVGRISLYLLDTKVEGNPEWARDVTNTLYGGDRLNRLRQELVLGIGGVRVLRRLGLDPSVFHMNEGHSAFFQVERMRELVEDEGLDRDAALERLRASTVFTTHTPVPAGNEVFDPELLRPNLAPLVERCGFEWDEFVELGKVHPDDAFGMTPFALRTSAFANGVSKLHASVSREMWHDLWPDVPVDDVPITSITNGVHVRTWLGGDLEGMLGTNTPRLERAFDLSDEDLWDAHRGSKARLLEFISRTRGAPGLDPEALTIGFARRFATYKRAGLLFSQAERLAALLGDRDRPLQILVAGKAHPADDAGKDVIRQVVDFARGTEHRVVFLPDYEMTLARRLVQGVDVWLNTPRRPMEASGTSGMKAALNGVLNCSILDGWWAEGYAPNRGFAIGGEGDPRAQRTEEEQDADDVEALYAVLEQQVLPAFFERDERGLPPRWLAMMRHSIAELGTEFSTNRMVREYVEKMYLPAHRDLAAVLAAV